MESNRDVPNEQNLHEDFQKVVGRAGGYMLIAGIIASPVGSFIYKNIKSGLYNGFKFVDFEGRRIKFDSPAKALFDFLYLKKTGDLEGFRVNWDIFNVSDRQEFKEIVILSKSSKMKKILKIIKW